MHSYRTLFLYIAMKTNAGVYYGYYNDNDDTRYYCYSYHSSLSQCTRYSSYYYSCGSYSDSLGLVCANTTAEGTHATPIVSACIDYVHNCTATYQECSNGDVRLVNGGGKENRGRVEYCYDGQWAPMCSLSVSTARLVCKSLGYEKYQC